MCQQGLLSSMWLPFCVLADRVWGVVKNAKDFTEAEAENR